MKKRNALFALSALLLAACGGGGSSSASSSASGLLERPAGDKIVIYTGGSSEFAWVKGSEEDRIITYIEDKYYEETGISLDFEISYLGEDMQTKLSSELAAGSQIDIVVSHTRGGVGLDDKLKGENSHYNLYDAIYELAPHLYDAVRGDPLDSMTTSTNDTVCIPSVISPYKFGILVRKDLMEQTGYTDDPAKVEEGYTLLDNLDDFEDMCLKMNAITGNSYAVTGAAWDLEKVLTLGAYADAGYFTSALVEEDNKELVRKGGCTSAYKEVLSREYQWAMKGVISKEANSIMLMDGESNFIAGKTGVFVLDPTIQHLIKVSRMAKAQNPEAEFTVLGPLAAHKGDTKKGFMRNPSATFGAAITKKSTRVNQIMGFLNWVYQSADNYNLCRYGIPDVHWVDNGDGTYSFPEGKEYYATSPAYSGIMTLVENQRMSNLRYRGYTEEEIRWIDEVAGNEKNYIQNDVMDYLFTMTDEYNLKQAQATEKLYAMAVDAWTGKADPLGLSANGVDCTFDAVAKEYREKVNEVDKHITEQYFLMKGMRG
ncbi:MAG: extracellular solute-binding protein [Candidatus Enteromonas sp.]|nr:extracellular solute-binding protein [Candidatus Enteromonas sp.]